MLRLSNIEKSFGDQLLFQKVSLSIHPGEKVGIVGPNGCGKSTFLQILAGLVEPDEGSVSAPGNPYIAYFAQQHDACSELETLSGGQRARLLLTRVLKERADIVLLDEPTNNLDLSALSWLESELSRCSSTCIVVSHDRQFLDNVTTRTIEIDPISGSVTDYSGNYSWYRTRKSQVEANQLRAYREQQERIKKLTADVQQVKEQACRTENKTVNDYIRGRAKKVAAKAKARETRLNRMIGVESIEKPKIAEKMRFSVSGRHNYSAVLLDMQALRFTYEEKFVLDEIDLQLIGNKRVILEGDNGSGKTTLLRLIMGELEPSDGRIWRRGNLRICYLPQVQNFSSCADSVLDYFRAAIQSAQLHFGGEGEMRTFLHRFQFSGSDVFKKVDLLSPGERTKLMFATFMAHEPDILILDEPTNHLDLPSRECLEEAVRSFRSALIVVSHDRYFVKTVEPDSRWVVKEGKVIVYL